MISTLKSLIPENFLTSEFKTLQISLDMLCLLFALAGVANAIVPDGMVVTPYGIRLSQCVLEVPNGAHLYQTDEANKLRVALEGADGVVLEERFHVVPPECSTDGFVDKYKRQIRERKLGRASRNITRVTGGDGWLDNAAYYSPSDSYGSFTSTYTVPGDPSQNTGQVLFFFIGFQNNDDGNLNILQPVLTWGNGLNGWSVASWDCCPSNITVQSPSLQGFGAGDQIKGIIQRDSSDQWTVDSIVGPTGQHATLYPQPGPWQYDWADVTQEVYSVTNCDQFAKGQVVFDALTLTDGYTGAGITAQWGATGATDCNGLTQVFSPIYITITHN